MMLGQFNVEITGQEWLPLGFYLPRPPILHGASTISDALLGLSYLSIAWVLAYFAVKRIGLKNRAVFLLFSLSMLASAGTHITSVLSLWQTLNWIPGGLKIISAGFAVPAAYYFAKLLPTALAMPTWLELQKAITDKDKYRQAFDDVNLNLQMANLQLDTLMEVLPDAIMLKDAAGRILKANDLAKQWFAFQGIAWQGKTVLELIDKHPNLAALYGQCLSNDEAAWQTRQVTVSTIHIEDGTGVNRDIELRKAPLFQKDRERNSLFVIVRDNTLFRQVEHDLRIAATAIESQQGIIITDADNRILRVNRAFTRLTGYSSADVLGKTPAVLRSDRHDKAFYQSMWGQLLAEHTWQGEVWDKRKNGEIYPKWLTITAVTGQAGQITNFVGAFTDLSEHKEAEVAIYRLAFYDPLTDLPNRRLFNDRLQQAMAASANHHGYCSILLIDLDNFKAINDTRGHGVGDLLLIEVARRLRQCVRQGDTVARLGGDEFVVMLEDLNSQQQTAAEEAERVGEKIMIALNKPYLLSGQTHYSSPSIGINLFSGTEVVSEVILKHADAAMYEAKHAGRNALRFFDPNMQRLLEARMNLETDLRSALEQDQLKLYYQMQVDHTGMVLGAEVLLRWIHPVHGLISPATFIPIAEDSGLIVPIGEWVMESVCQQLIAWANNPVSNSLYLAVNVSPRQFRQADFVANIIQLLKQTAINPSQIKLELTESLVMYDIPEAIDKMQELSKFGVCFSLDDFGTGYSSLNYLRKLPLVQLKIDRSFVYDIISDPNDEVIVQTIIGMAKNLGLEVIAEGVETEAQRACLEGLGCFVYQGYLFSVPVPLANFEALLQSRFNRHLPYYKSA